MPATKAARAGKRGRNPNRTKPHAYRWIIVKEETWAKVERIMKRMEDQGLYPGKLNINKVASIEFEKAIAALPENPAPPANRG